MISFPSQSLICLALVGRIYSAYHFARQSDCVCDGELAAHMHCVVVVALHLPEAVGEAPFTHTSVTNLALFRR